MPLAATSRAIGAVSLALKQRIDSISGLSVSVGRPSEPSTTNPHLNLFLYEVAFDPFLKNTSLNDGEKPPLWVVLKYLLTAFEAAEDSDSELAHNHLGSALRAVNTDDLLRLDGLPAPVIEALDANPSPLHVTFDESPADLVAKLMQGPDDKVRLSACFQVRPVMIAPAEPGDYSLLVGIDYTATPAPVPTEPYVGLDVIPSMGPSITEISPIGFEVGEVVTLKGTDMHLSGLSVMLGDLELPVVMQQPDELRFRVDPTIIAASSISAGSYPVAVVQTLGGTGKRRRSKAVIGNLVPTLRNPNPLLSPATIIGAVTISGPNARATIELNGLLLGDEEDDTMLAFHRDGVVTNVFEDLVLPPGPPPARQTVRRLVMPVPPPPPDPEHLAVAAGDYRLILIVNGQQAPQSPSVHLNVP